MKNNQPNYDHEVKEIPSNDEDRTASSSETCPPSRPACPACGGALIEIRGKVQCKVCHTICETCCEGGRG